jgi:type I restriction enzyme R subunit
VALLDHPVVTAIESGQQVSDEQLLNLERAMRRELSSVELTEAKIRRAYHVEVDSFIAFMRFMFDLDGIPDYRDIVTRHFDDFARRHHFNAWQTTFLRVIRSQFLQRRRLQVADLYDPPFTRLRHDPNELFSAEQLKSMMALTERLTVVIE